MPRRRPSTPTLLLGSLSATAVLAGTVLFASGQAAADSFTTREHQLAAQLAQLRAQQAAVGQQTAATTRQLAALDNTAEMDAEALDGARVRLAVVSAQAAAAARRVTDADHRVAALQRSLGVFAADAYQSGGLGTLEVVSGDAQPATLLDQLSDLDVVARGQADLLQSLRIARQQRASAAAADRLAVLAQQAVVGQIAAARARVEHDASLTQQLLAELQFKQGTLVKAANEVAAREAATKRAAAAAAARRAAELAARRAAELAAQRRAAAAAAAAFAAESPSGTTGPTQPTPSGPVANAAQVAVQWAYRELGKPYVWGAAGPDAFDCSGLTQFVWAQAGVYIPHYTGDQWNIGVHVPVSALQPGDLLFFYPPTLHHVGIYVGNGMFIQAPHTGTVVQLSPFAGYWSSVFAGAVDPLG